MWIRGLIGGDFWIAPCSLRFVFLLKLRFPATDTLFHASLLANCIRQITDDYAQHHASESHSGLIWTIHHSAEAIKALTDAVLDAMER